MEGCNLLAKGAFVRYWPPMSTLLRGSALLGMLVLCLGIEHLLPLRKATQPKSRRVVLNLTIGAVGAVALGLVFYPIVLAVSDWTTRSGFGILPRLGLAPLAQLILAILVLDYTFYFWHWMNHRIPFLWRFHNVHHVDLDLDVSTASRFHFGELILSTGFRSGQIVLFGIDPFTFLLFETLIVTAAQFHHSNIRLPLRFETYLNKVLVTPRMHGIHHSIVRAETDSNFSTIFSFWDRLHRSLRLDIPQARITIGIAEYRDPRELGLRRVLQLPFLRQRPRT